MNTGEGPRAGLRRTLVRALLVALAWYGGARLGLALSFEPDYIAAFWPPNAILLAALILTHPRDWWIYLLAVVPAELAADVPHGVSVTTALGFVAADWVEVIVAALLLRRWLPEGIGFSTFRQIVRYLGAAALLGPVIAAFAGALATDTGTGSPSFWVRWQRWAFSDAVTHLTLTPLLILLTDARAWFRRTGRILGIRLAEPALYLSALTFACFLAFGPAHGSEARSSALLFLPIPVLLWAAARFRPVATFGSATFLALTAILYAHAGHGPFTTAAIAVSVIQLQASLLLCLTPLLVLAVLMEERLRTEEKIRESEETHRHLVEQQVDMVVEMDAEGRLLFVSPSYCETFGKTQEELLGRRFLPLLHEEDRKRTERALEDLVRHPHQAYLEHRAMTKDGWRWLAWTNRAILDDDGEVVTVIAVGRDIHDRKLAQESLRESEDRYRSLVENAPVPVFVHRDGRFVFVNPEAERLLGKSAEELLGSSLLDVAHPDEMERLRVTLETLAKEPDEKLVLEFRVTPADGSVLTIETTSMSVTYDGEPARLVIGVDRTASQRARREKAELVEQLGRSQRMEALGLLAGGVAHDLNNILSGIMSYPELLLMDLEETSPLRKPLLTIEESGRRAAAVVQDMLTIARGIASPRKVASLDRVVRSCLDSAEIVNIRRRFPDVRLDFERAPDLLDLRCSEVHLTKALGNLILNAFEAMGGSGRIRIATENRYVDSKGPRLEELAAGEYVVLIVEDDGPGIAEEDLGHIFEPFFTKRKLGRGGTGLGLAVVWNTVQDHGGTIEVRSGTEGTKFRISLPATRERQEGEEEDIPIEEFLGDGERVLVVDDEPLQRKIARGILERLGYEVDTAEDGETAVRLVRERNHDLVLLDMIMPGLDGCQTYERMVEERPGQRALIASGFSPTEDVRRTQALGAGAYLRKPYTLEQVGRAVKKELSSTSPEA